MPLLLPDTEAAVYSMAADHGSSSRASLLKSTSNGSFERGVRSGSAIHTAAGSLVTVSVSNLSMIDKNACFKEQPLPEDSSPESLEILSKVQRTHTKDGPVMLAVPCPRAGIVLVAQRSSSTVFHPGQFPDYEILALTRFA